MSDTALTTSCIAMAVACHKHMIAPALDYKPSPVNTALLSADMALWFLRRTTAEHTTAIQKAAQERIVAKEKAAALRAQQQEDSRRAQRLNQLALDHARAKETARVVSRDLHCRHTAHLFIERWLLSRVLCRRFHRHRDKHAGLQQLCAGASTHARSIKAVRAIQHWLRRNSRRQQLLRGASYFSSHCTGHMLRRLSVAQRKQQSAPGTLGSNTASFGSLQRRDHRRTPPVPRGSGRRRQQRRRPHLHPHRRYHEMQPPPHPPSPAASPRPVTSSKITGGYETVLPLYVWVAQSAAADLRLSLGHRRRRLLPPAPAATMIQRVFKQFTSRRTAREFLRCRHTAACAIQRSLRTAFIRRRHAIARVIQRCCRYYLFRLRLHPHPEGLLHKCAKGDNFSRLLIGMNLSRDCYRLEDSITSTMTNYFLPTTDRDLSIKAHLAEARGMSKYQKLLHLMKL